RVRARPPPRQTSRQEANPLRHRPAAGATSPCRGGVFIPLDPPGPGRGTARSAVVGILRRRKRGGRRRIPSVTGLGPAPPPGAGEELFYFRRVRARLSACR